MEVQRSIKANPASANNGLTFLYLAVHRGIRLQARRRGDGRGRSRGQGARCGRRTYSSPAMVLSLFQSTAVSPRRQSSSAMVLPLIPSTAVSLSRGRRGFHGQVHARAKHQLYVRAVRLHGSIHQLQLAEHPSAAASGTTCERKEGEATACSPIGNPYLTDATAANFFHWSFHSLSAPLWTQTNKVAASGTRSQEPCLTYI